MFLLASCGSGSNDAITPEVKTVVAETTEYEMEIGASKTMAYAVYGIGDYDKSVTISSDNEAVATAKLNEDFTFTVSALAEGLADIEIKSVANPQKAAYVAISVGKVEPIVVTPEITGLTVSATNIGLEVGGEVAQVTIEVAGKGDYDKTVSITNSNPEFFSIDKTSATSGDTLTIDPNAEGRGTIEVVANGDKKFSQNIYVLVEKNIGPVIHDKVVLDDTRKEVFIDETVVVRAISHTGPVSFHMEGTGHESIANIEAMDDESVTIKGLGEGAATLVAECGTYKATCLIVVSVNQDPTLSSAFISINNGEQVELNKTYPLPPEADYSAQFTMLLNSVSASDTIDFYGKVGSSTFKMVDNIAPSGDDLGNLVQNNLKPATLGGKDWTVLQDAEDAKLYLEKRGEGYTFWLEGGPEIEVETPKLVGLGGDWTTGVRMLPNGEGGEYKINGLTINASEQFKLKFDTLWAGYDNVKQDCRYLVSRESVDGNIIMNETGKYDIYWDTTVEGESIWIEKYNEPIPEYSGYKAEINEVMVDFTKVDVTDPPEGLKAKYKLDITELVEAGTRIDFYGTLPTGDVLLNQHIGPSADDATNKQQNNLKPLTSGGVDWAVLKDIETGTLYLEEYNDGYSFWLTGGPATLEGYYLKINGIPSVQLAHDDEETQYNQYKAIGVELAKNDVIELYDGSFDATWMASLEKYDGFVEFTENAGKNLVCNTAGKYDFYVKFSLEVGDTVYIGYNGEEPTYTYSVSLGGEEPITLGVDESTMPEDAIHQWSTDASLVAGDSVEFFKNEDSIDNIKVGKGSNNVTGIKEEGFSIVKDFTPEAGHKSLYLKQLKDGSFEIWGNGNDGPGPSPNPIYAYVLNDEDPVVLTPGQDPSGNPQLEALNIEMEAGDTIFFENIAPVTPEPLTSLELAGDDKCDFTGLNGVLTAGRDGTFNFFVKLDFGNDKVYVSESSGPSPVVKDYVLHGKIEGSTEWSDIDLSHNTTVGKENEWYIQNLSLLANDVFVIHFTGDAWYKAINVKSDVEVEYDADADGNIVIVNDGVYDIYCDSTSTEEHANIWIQESEVKVPSVEFKAEEYTAKVETTFEVEVLLQNCPDNTEVDFACVDGNVAEVLDIDGLKASVIAVGIGETTIEASIEVEGETYEAVATIKISAKDPEMIKIYFSAPYNFTVAYATYREKQEAFDPKSVEKIIAKSTYENEHGETVYCFEVDKANNTYVAFHDGYSLLTLPVLLSDCQTDSGFYCKSELSPSFYELGTWTHVANRTLYLGTGGSDLWDKDGAVFFIYYWDIENEITPTSVKLEMASGSTYKVSIPVEARYFIFVRMPSGSTIVDWDSAWNQTTDLTITGDNNMYTITGWGSGTKVCPGSWSKYSA